jgi:hypothetical protein
MSVSSISQSNELGADVLQMIFQQLDGEDLVNCEDVCHQWWDILLAGTPWKKLFHRKKKSFPLWRGAQKTLKKNQPMLNIISIGSMLGGTKEDVFHIGIHILKLERYRED